MVTILPQNGYKTKTIRIHDKLIDNSCIENIDTKNGIILKELSFKPSEGAETL